MPDEIRTQYETSREIKGTVIPSGRTSLEGGGSYGFNPEDPLEIHVDPDHHGGYIRSSRAMPTVKKTRKAAKTAPEPEEVLAEELDAEMEAEDEYRENTEQGGFEEYETPQTARRKRRAPAPSAPAPVREPARGPVYRDPTIRVVFELEGYGDVETYYQHRKHSEDIIVLLLCDDEFEDVPETVPEDRIDPHTGEPHIPLFDRTGGFGA